MKTRTYPSPNFTRWQCPGRSGRRVARDRIVCPQMSKKTEQLSIQAFGSPYISMPHKKEDRTIVTKGPCSLDTVTDSCAHTIPSTHHLSSVRCKNTTYAKSPACCRCRERSSGVEGSSSEVREHSHVLAKFERILEIGRAHV